MSPTHTAPHQHPSRPSAATTVGSRQKAVGRGQSSSSSTLLPPDFIRRDKIPQLCNTGEGRSASRAIGRSSVSLWATGLALAVAGGTALVSCVPRSTLTPSLTLGRCTTCHPRQLDQIRGSRHEEAGLGCVTCHGLSKAHAAAGTTAVRPDRVFARYDIDPLCGGCHYASCEHAQTYARPSRGTPRKTCADCHGAHRARRLPPPPPSPAAAPLSSPLALPTPP